MKEEKEEIDTIDTKVVRNPIATTIEKREIIKMGETPDILVEIRSLREGEVGTTIRVIPMK